MRTILVLALLAVAVSATVTMESFESWASARGKVYKTAEEKTNRFSIFASNMAFIERHNKETAQGLHSFRLGANRFADLTNEEYRHRFASGVRHGKSPRASAIPMPIFPEMDLPTSWDWRQKNAVNDIKDQGACGSCWAFSATAAMETAWFLSSGKLLSLSEQMCVDCVDGGADNCELGGEMHDCYLQVISQGGDETEQDYPYCESSGNSCLYNSTKAVTHFSKYVNVTQYNETALEIAAVQTVVSVAIDASSTMFQFYSGGVYDQKSCKWKYDDLDHGVAVIGYGALDGKNYWLVRNSWGTDWGLDGYILMSKDKNNQCGIATDATVPIV